MHSALVDPEIILARLPTVEERYRAAAEQARSWLLSFGDGQEMNGICYKQSNVLA
jgi:hypothetical protein